MPGSPLGISATGKRFFDTGRIDAFWHSKPPQIINLLQYLSNPPFRPPSPKPCSRAFKSFHCLVIAS
jgi:hypothetical protein